MAYKKILIAIDNEPISEKVTSSGFQLGQQLNVEFALVSIVDTRAIMTGEGGILSREIADMLKNDCKKNQQMLIERIFGDNKVWTFVEEGEPYEMILKTAEEWQANLIVLGTRGRAGLPHLVMGSVAEKVVRHSAKPLFIIPTK